MSTVSVLTFAFGVVLAAFVKADDIVYPFVANHTCPNKTWVAEPFGFGTYDAPNALLRPEGTSPYVLRLQDRIYAGQTIFIEGKIAENPGDTSFNLLAGIVDLDDNDGEVALHWTQQYSKGEGFVTAKVNGQFESDVLYTDLLAVNEEFKIAIRVLEDCFEIYKGGIKVGNYTHRVPIDIIDHIVIIGDIEINALRVVGRQFPRPFRPIFHGTHLMLNDRIRIEARTFDWFFFSLLEKNQNEIAFELFVDIPAKRVRRNSRINGTWGVPEADGPWYFPTEGYIFVLEIVNMEEHLSLMVNGNVYGTFKRRVQNPKEDYVVFEHYIKMFDIFTLEVCSD